MLRLLHLALALQANQATIVGSVKDAGTGEPLNAAVVAFTDIDRTALTDSLGIYRLSGVPAGPQHVSVHLLGYAQRTLHALVPATGELVINVLLRPAPIPMSELAVRTAVPVRGVEHDHVPHPDRAASASEVRNHPLLAEPDVFQALGGGEVVLTPESPTGIHIRGGAADQTAYVLDGVPIFNPYHSAGLFSAWNPDALSLIQLSSVARSPLLPDALSGVVVGVTRTPGSQISAQGSFTTIQTRATIDGPLQVVDGGYVVSLRTSYPSFIAPGDEATYLNGDNGDLLVKVEARMLGGSLRVLSYDSENEIGTAARANVGADAGVRNEFEWHSRSTGVRWSREGARNTIDVQAWSAASDAQARWTLRDALSAILTTDRHDVGLVMAWKHRSGETTTNSGIRLERSETSYHADVDPVGTTLQSLQATTRVTTGFLQHARKLGDDFVIDAAASVAAANGDAQPALQAQLRWLATRNIALSGALSRSHQFTQSLRNPESLVGSIFPVDLHVGAGHARIPVAQSDQAILAAELRPAPGLRIGVQGYTRRDEGLVLVAVRDSQPFATSDVEIGSGKSRGIALDVALSAARYGLLGSYGWQRTRLSDARGSYVPSFATAHNVELGVIAFPSPTLSIRIGGVAALGRRASRVIGGIEWEACNLIDRGCEFAGSPRVSPDALGATELPGYVRVDLGARKHWHIDIGSRDISVALFGTVTNIFARKNLLNYAYDPASGAISALQLRPPSPLVVGIDWRF